MQSTDWHDVGGPLIEQDAEYLSDLIRAQDFPCRIEHRQDSTAAEAGRTHFVQVRRMHLQFAREIRANEFPEPGDKPPKESKPMSPFTARLLKSCGAAAVGMLAGLRVGAKLRGGGLGTLLGGLAMGILSFVTVLVISGRAQEGSSNGATEVSDSDNSKNV
ncbi:MAG: hypothetical protein KF696_08345 [Planctomycetes bacterium]|nr:hypothetical protein [Planctomycetota bacterium]MCW8135639.1 hypothetical protein [Planctomycetota bacterium]